MNAAVECCCSPWKGDGLVSDADNTEGTGVWAHSAVGLLWRVLHWFEQEDAGEVEKCKPGFIIGGKGIIEGNGDDAAFGTHNYKWGPV